MGKFSGFHPHQLKLARCQTFIMQAQQAS